MRCSMAIFIILAFLLHGCSEDDPVTPPAAETGELVLIQAGSFTMGSSEDEPGHNGDEGQHPVTLTNDFFMFSTEVTNKQYAVLAQWALDNDHCSVVGTRLHDNLDGSTLELLDMDEDEDCEISFDGSTFVIDPGKEDHPVKEVNWFGAASYCDWLSMKEGLTRAYDHEDPTNWKCNGGAPYQASGYRLPTEAEWEYACRAGTTTAFAGGDITEIGCEDEPSLSSMGWYCGNTDGWTSPVAQMSHNAFGLYDMHGNLWEWCNDWYDSTYRDEEIDPIGPPPGWYKVLRGGGWSDVSRHCRSASRLNPSPHLGVNGRHGFRYVITSG